MSIYQEAKEMEQQLLTWREQIHHHPELGKKLPQTTALVKSVLDELGIPWEELIPCGIVGVIGKPEGKRILLRADMDALPMSEETGLPFASECDGVMHSCGHDCHTSMLLTAAALLKRHENELKGQVILMFQPDEEGTEGGGARPHQSINPILCAMKIAEAFTDIGRYEVDVQQPTALSICTFHSGTASNIIPEECVFSGTLRTFNEEVRQFTLERMRQVSAEIAQAYRCQLDLELYSGTPALICDPAFSNKARDWAYEGLHGDGVDVPPISYEKSMGSEDFAFISSRIPSCSISVGSTSHQDQVYPLHHPKIIFDEAGLCAGAAAYAQVAYSYLTE